jgi:putative hydrolase of the HAD superfamily
MQIAAIIFDRDHTLLAFDPARVEAIVAHVHAIAPLAPAGAAMEHWANWPGPWPQQPADEDAFWDTFWRTFAQRHSLNEAQHARLCAEIGPIYHTVFSAYPDSMPCLQELRAADLRLAVLTNFELPSVDRTLRHAGIDPDLFECLLSSSSLGVQKPDPRAFVAVAAALRLSPELCLFVDDLRENVEAARSIGMKALRIDRTSNADSSEPGVLSSLAALPGLILPPS